MRISQYVYLALNSATLSADEMAARLEMPPDKTLTAGSRSAEPLPPGHTSWQAHADEPLPVDEQLAALLGRLEPIRAAIAALCARDDVSAVVQVVRYFDDPDGQEEVLDETEDGMVKLSGQHQLLGWQLERVVLQFVVEVGAVFDVDEYG